MMQSDYLYQSCGYYNLSLCSQNLFIIPTVNASFSTQGLCQPCSQNLSASPRVFYQPCNQNICGSPEGCTSPVVRTSVSDPGVFTNPVVRTACQSSGFLPALQSEPQCCTSYVFNFSFSHQWFYYFCSQNLCQSPRALHSLFVHVHNKESLKILKG